MESCGATRERAGGRAVCDCEPLHVSYAREFQWGAGLEAECEQTLRKLNRWIIYYSGAYCLDLDFGLQAGWHPEGGADEQMGVPEIGERKSSGKVTLLSMGTLRHSKWKRELSFGWLSRLLLVCFLASTAYVLIVLCFQYAYDFDLLRVLKLRQLQRRLAQPPSDPFQAEETARRMSSLRAQELTLTARMIETKVTLDFLGRDYADLTIQSECFYLVALGLCQVIYLTLYVHYRFRRFDYHTVRDLLDQERENAHIGRMLRRQVTRYLKSSRVFSESLANCHPSLGLQANLQLAFDASIHGSEMLARVKKQMQTQQQQQQQQQNQLIAGGVCGRERESELDGLVREMLASGALTPLYKLRAWTQRCTSLQFSYHVGITIYALVFNYYLVLGFFAQNEDPESSLWTSPSVLQVACVAMLLLCGPSLLVHAPVFMIVVLEQLNYVRQLRLMARRCIEQNSRLFARLIERTKSGGDPAAGDGARGCAHLLGDAARTMNSNLILLLLHYKIFVAQLRPIKRSLGFVNIVALALLFNIPTVARIHEPYLSQLAEDNLSRARLKLFALAISSSVLLPANLTSAPLCVMFARCQDLYRDLASLMAHISEVGSHITSGRGLYDGHAQSCLIKELSDPGRLLDRLTVRACGISGTYTMLVKAHFWFGLIVISILADNNYESAGGGELLKSLLGDPLGVYARIKAR